MGFPREVDSLEAIYTTAEAAAKALQLPFRHQQWKGTVGNWLGAGVGSSIDFQDHRPYLPGDDPRYINWQAYARTGSYSMKLYREEVSPVIDLALDVSASMAHEPAKAQRSLELFYYCAIGALQTGAALRTYIIRGRDVAAIPTDALRGHRWLTPEAGEPDIPDDKDRKAAPPETAPDLRRLPWRPKALRIFVSDLLYPGAPSELFATAGAGAGGIIFCPWTRAESDPDWFGNVELIGVETGERVLKHYTEAMLADYRQSYRNHFSQWRSFARSRGVKLARVEAGPPLLDELAREALKVGAVEVWV